MAHLLVRKAHAGQAMPDLDLFGEKPQRQVSTSKAGRPRVPLRVMVSLLYLKHAFNESDEGVVERWRDTPRWQFFSGCAYYEVGPEIFISSMGEPAGAEGQLVGQCCAQG